MNPSLKFLTFFWILTISIGNRYPVEAQSLVFPNSKTNAIHSGDFQVEVIKEKGVENANLNPIPSFMHGMWEVIWIKNIRKNPVEEIWIKPSELESDVPLLSVHLIALDHKNRRLVFSWSLDNGKVGGDLVYIFNLDTKITRRIGGVDGSPKFLISPSGRFLGYSDDIYPNSDAPEIESAYSIIWGIIDLDNGKVTEKIYNTFNTKEQYSKFIWRKNTLALYTRYQLGSKLKYSNWKFNGQITIESNNGQ